MRACGKEQRKGDDECVTKKEAAVVNLGVVVRRNDEGGSFWWRFVQVGRGERRVLRVDRWWSELERWLGRWSPVVDWEASCWANVAVHKDAAGGGGVWWRWAVCPKQRGKKIKMEEREKFDCNLF